eukprot:4347338-Alexandrium_andersonii.AAC.1
MPSMLTVTQCPLASVPWASSKTRARAAQGRPGGSTGGRSRPGRRRAPSVVRSSQGLGRDPCVGHKAHTEGAPRARHV